MVDHENNKFYIIIHINEHIIINSSMIVQSIAKPLLFGNINTWGKKRLIMEKKLSNVNKR